MKVPQDQLARRAALAEKLRLAFDVLTQRVDDFNGAQSTAWDRVRLALEDYESVLSEARELRDEVAADLEMVISEKSENWQESERGQSATSLMESWAEIDLEEIDLEEPNDLTVPDVGHSDELEGAPEESE